MYAQTSVYKLSVVMETPAKVRKCYFSSFFTFFFSTSFGALNTKYNITLLENRHYTSVLSKSMYNLFIYAKFVCSFSGGALLNYPLNDWKVTTN